METSLLTEKWLPQLERDWPIVKPTTGRREYKQNPEDLIEIHNALSTLHRIAVMEFLKMYGNSTNCSGTMDKIVKGKMILYQLIEGCSNGDVPGVSKSTYRRIFDSFWKGNSELIEEWFNSWITRFSTPEIRALYAKVNNLEPFKHVTMMIDGKDFVQCLSDLRNERKKTKNGKSSLTSHKNNFKNGGKVVFLDDIRMNPLMISEIYGANEKYDGHIMKEMKIYNLMGPETDCVMFDHHFDSEARNFIKTSECKNRGFSLKNICPSVAKQRNIPLTNDERKYQKEHGAFRSQQESERNANLVNKFKIFSANSKKKITTFNELLLQIKVCSILITISKEATENEEIFSNLFSEWEDHNFTFPVEETPVHSQRIISLLANSKEMCQSQNEVLEQMFFGEQDFANDEMDFDSLYRFASTLPSPSESESEEESNNAENSSI